MYFSAQNAGFNVMKNTFWPLLDLCSRDRIPGCYKANLGLVSFYLLWFFHMLHMLNVRPRYFALVRKNHQIIMLTYIGELSERVYA